MTDLQYEFKTAKFTGPLEKLLELIEAREMEIADVALAEVTEDFLRYLAEIRAAYSRESEGGETLPEDLRALLRLLADFLVVASRLILIKSKSLLPSLELTEEEEQSITDLEKRLALYRVLRPAMKAIQRAWVKGPISAARPYFLNVPAFLETQLKSGGGIFFPGTHLSVPALESAIAKITAALAAMSYEQETITEKIISLEDEMTAIVERIRSAGEMSLRTLSADRSRAEVIVVFLALLHLARDQMIALSQEERFSDILVVTGKNGEEPVVSSESFDPAQDE